MRPTKLRPGLPRRVPAARRHAARGVRASRGRGPGRGQRGIVLFVCLILLLVLTLLGVSLARQQTVEERLAQNEFNHEVALQAAQAMLQAGYDDVGGSLAPGSSSTAYTGGATPGLATLGEELINTQTALDRTADWGSPGVNTISYGDYGAPLTGVPAAAAPQFVVESMPPAPPKWCEASNPGTYGGSGTNVQILRVTAHAAGGDGTASATVQMVRYEGC